MANEAYRACRDLASLDVPLPGHDSPTSSVYGSPLECIRKAAGSESACRSVYLTAHLSGRPPTEDRHAAVLGWADGVAALLLVKGFAVETSLPYETHDYDGPNGVTCSVRVSW